MVKRQSQGHGDLTVHNNVVDLAARKELQEPMRAVVVVLPIRSGTMLSDKRLGPPAVIGESFMWLIEEEKVKGIDPPFIFPHFEK